MRTVVQLRFAENEFGKVVWNAPFLVSAEREAAFYQDEPTVWAQMDASR